MPMSLQCTAKSEHMQHLKITDVLVCIGALSKDMAEAAKETVLATEKNMKVFHFDTKEDFYQNMGQILKENDTITGQSFPLYGIP